MPKSYLYAELLLNIRQVTVFAILPSSSNEGTRVFLEADQRTICVEHDSEQSAIQLPCSVARNENLQLPPRAVLELSFRLRLSTDTESQTLAVMDPGSVAPWSAPMFTQETQVSCRSCGSQLVKGIVAWKDLPSGGWADMMDFWHCHKPNVEEGTIDSAGGGKGYAASNVIGPTTGIGLVDVTHFWFSQSDCYDLEVRQRLLIFIQKTHSLLLP